MFTRILVTQQQARTLIAQGYPVNNKANQGKLGFGTIFLLEGPTSTSGKGAEHGGVVL